MDPPRFGLGEEWSSLFQASSLYSSSAVRDGFLPAQALRGGYIAPLDGVRRVEASPELITHIVQRELMKQRIRGEIIAREMPEMRLLVEEVRTELEMERALRMGRFQEGTFSSMGNVPALAEARTPVEASRFGLGFGVERTIVATRSVGERPCDVNMFGERLLQGVPTGRSMKDSALPKSDHENKGLASTFAHNVKPSKANVAGIKREIDNIPGIAENKVGTPPGSAKPDWSCALCHVSINRREDLNEHLRGRKHKAKQALLMRSTKVPGGSTSRRTAKKRSTLAKGRDLEKAQANPVRKRASARETGVRPLKKHKTVTSPWLCKLCKVECSSNKMLASHLGGKKHKTRLSAAQRSTRAVAEKTTV